jgi:branched-chain amino acid transport system substrate-binding protein
MTQTPFPHLPWRTLSLTCLAAALTAALPVAQAQTVVRIGHVGPVSGPQAHYGRDNENGARMAVDELNKQGVTIAGKKVKFELVAEDDAADPKQGTAAAQKLCDAKVNGVVGHLNSGTTIPAAKIYNQCGLPMVTPSATNPELTQLGYKNVYRLLANDNELGAGLARYAAQTLHLKKVAIIDDRTAYGKGVAEVFAKVAKEMGLEVVSQQYTNDKAVDFMSILTAIKSRRPDGIMFGGMDPQAGPMLRQMQQLGMTKVYLFGGDGICTDKLVDLSSGARTLGNVVCAVGGAAIDKMPDGKAWRARYDAAFPGQFQVYSPYTYDATMVLVDAMKRANSVDPKVYAAKLPETHYQGVSAKVMFEPNGELKNPAMTLYVYKNGKKVPLN